MVHTPIRTPIRIRIWARMCTGTTSAWTSPDTATSRSTLHGYRLVHSYSYEILFVCGLVKLIPAVAYHICLNLPATTDKYNLQYKTFLGPHLKIRAEKKNFFSTLVFTHAFKTCSKVSVSLVVQLPKIVLRWHTITNLSYFNKSYCDCKDINLSDWGLMYLDIEIR